VLELRPAGASAASAKATARTKRTLANVLADFGNGRAWRILLATSSNAL